jgi:hypothetical protein
MSSDDTNLSGKRVVEADLSQARLHGPNFWSTKVTDGFFVDADFSGDIEGLRINGVEVAPLVEAELDRQFPERLLLRATDPVGLAVAWELVERIWTHTDARARALPETALHESVDDEWSYVATLRHLIMATDCWLGRMINGEPRPWHRWGLAGEFLKDPARIGLEVNATPSLNEVAVVRRRRMDAVRQTIAAVTPTELERTCVPPDDGNHPNAPHTVLHCLHVILNEEWEHHRYANRDLEQLESKIA